MATRAEAIPEAALAAGLQKISGERFFFGHQSVGKNLLDGIGEISGEVGSVSPNVTETRLAADASKPGICHAYVGENGNPGSKIRDFEAILRSGMAGRVDAAFLKFCYVDVTASTDVAALFGDYRASMASLRKDYPGLAIIHFTVPVMTEETGFKALAKKLLGKPLSGAADNLAREGYNALLRAEYGGKEPIFDIAKVESQSAAGEALRGRLDGRSYYALRPEFSQDGGHLNAAGRRQAAGHLIIALSALVNYAASN